MNVIVSADVGSGRAAVRALIERGFELVFYPTRSKTPRDDGWPERSYILEDYREGQNVGVKLGCELQPERFSVDVDFDWTGKGAREMGKAVLPETGFAFGRSSRPLSHAFYTASAPLSGMRFDGLDGRPIVELRGRNQQTMVPPSVHPSGEVLQMLRDGEPAHVVDVRCRVALYASGCLLLQSLSEGARGFGHPVRIAFAGTLLKLRVSVEDVIAIGEVVAEHTGNDVADVEPCVRDTAAKVAKREPIAAEKPLAAALGSNGKAIVALIKKWLGAPRETPGPDAIVITGGDLTAVVDRAEGALLASDRQIYQRGGALIRPVRIDSAAPDAVRRAVGTTVLIPVRDAWLTEAMGQSAKWFKPTRSGPSRCDPPALYAHTLLARGQWTFPTLRAVLSAPTLASDGRTVEAPGFDQGTGLLLDFAAGTFPTVPAQPSRDDARAALDRLVHPLRGFPFVDEAAKSVALSAILTALVRPSLRTAPLHAFDAPTAGTGKSLLAEVVGLVATGIRPPAMSQGKTPEEDEKRLATVALAGDPVVHLDNCERPVTGDFICSWLSQESVQVRILGQSERRVLPSVAHVLASGNNLTVAADMCRRTVLCRLDAKVERPDSRRFDFDCHAEVIAARAALVVAGLTVLRAYHAAGRPERLKPVGGFVDWDWIRGALVWLGCADPADTREAILADDPRRDELTTVMDLWANAIGSQSVKVGDIDSGAINGVVLPKVWALKTRLIELACKGVWSSKSVGWWLTRHKDRVVGGRAFRSESSNNRQRWRLEGAKDAEKMSHAEVIEEHSDAGM